MILQKSKRWAWNRMKCVVRQGEKSFEHCPRKWKNDVTFHVTFPIHNFQGDGKPGKAGCERDDTWKTKITDEQNIKTSSKASHITKKTQPKIPSPQKKTPNRTYCSANPPKKSTREFYVKNPARKSYRNIKFDGLAPWKKWSLTNQSKIDKLHTHNYFLGTLVDHEKDPPGFPTNNGTAKVMFLKDGPGHASWRSQRKFLGGVGRCRVAWMTRRFEFIAKNENRNE